MQPDCTGRPTSRWRSLAALVLALCVLAGQFGLARHDLGHALDRLAASASADLSADDEAEFGADAGSGRCDPDESDRARCPLHALFSELASFAPGSSPAAAVDAQAVDAETFPGAPALAAPRVAFRSRAPPVLPA